MYLFLKWLRVILLFVLGVCEHYWKVFFAVTEGLKKKFDENEITIPFPQRDVHLFDAWIMGILFLLK